MSGSRFWSKSFVISALMLTAQSLPAFAGPDFGANGFGSFYYGQAMNDKFLPNSFTDTSPDFTHFSNILWVLT